MTLEKLIRTIQIGYKMETGRALEAATANRIAMLISLEAETADDEEEVLAAPAQAAMPRSPAVVSEADEPTPAPLPGLIIKPDDVGAWDEKTKNEVVGPYRAATLGKKPPPGSKMENSILTARLRAIVETAPEQIEFMAEGRTTSITIDRSIHAEEALGVVKLVYSHPSLLGGDIDMSIAHTFSIQAAAVDIEAVVKEITAAAKVLYRPKPARIESTTAAAGELRFLADKNSGTFALISAEEYVSKQKMPQLPMTRKQ